MLKDFIFSNYFAIILFFILAVFFTLPVFYNIENYGIYDWSIHFFFYGVPYKSVLEFGQFPLWNPYYCGGNVLLADPHSLFLSPAFVLTLIFGVVTGLKISIMIYAFLGMVGFYFLSKELGLKNISAFLPSIIFIMGGIYPVNIAVGHTSWMSMAWLPFVYLFFFRGLKDKKNLILSAFFLTLIFFHGHGNLFLFTSLSLILYSILCFLQLRQKKFFFVAFSIIALSFLLGAIKFIPMIEFMMRYPNLKNFYSVFDFETYVKTLLDGNLLNNIKDLFKYHEFYDYIGIVPFVLVIVGAFYSFKNSNLKLNFLFIKWPFILTGLIFVFLSFGIFSDIFDKIIFLRDARILSRYNQIFIFVASVLAGIGLSKIENIKKYGVIVSILIFSFIITDLINVNGAIFRLAFPYKPEKINSSNEIYSIKTFNEEESDLYHYFLNNKLPINCYSPYSINNSNAIPKYISNELNPNYKGEAFLLSQEDSASIFLFSPNIFKIKINSTKEDVLVINQNYYEGWRTSDGREVYPTKGLVSTNVNHTDNEITLYYLPDSFLIGLLISFIFVIVGALFFIKKLNFSLKL